MSELKGTAFAVHGVVSFSSCLSLVAWPDCCFVFGTRDCPLGNGFGSSGWYAHSPLDSFHCPNFAQGQEDYFATEALWVLSDRDLFSMGFLGVDLTLPCLTVTLTNTRVLPTDGANCRDKVWNPSPNVWNPGPISPIQ